MTLGSGSRPVHNGKYHLTEKDTFCTGLVSRKACPVISFIYASLLLGDLRSQHELSKMRIEALDFLTLAFAGL